MRSTAHDREAAAADGRGHQPDDRPDVLHRVGARGLRRRDVRASTSAYTSSTSASRPASRRSRPPSSAASATSTGPRSAASSSGSSRSAAAVAGFNRWGPALVFARPDHHRSCSDRPASSASSWASGHERRVRTCPPAPAAPPARRRAIARRFSERHRSTAVLIGMIVVGDGPAADRAPAAVQRLQQPERVDRRLHDRRHLRAAGARAEHRRRPVRACSTWATRRSSPSGRTPSPMAASPFTGARLPVLADAPRRRGRRRGVRHPARRARRCGCAATTSRS